MNQKLTLKLSAGAIAKGKQFAQRNNTSLSKMVQDYFLLLDEGYDVTSMVPISKKLSTLVGIGAGTFSTDDYRAHLERKYQ